MVAGVAGGNVNASIRDDVIQNGTRGRPKLYENWQWGFRKA